MNQVAINTTQNVNISFGLASLGERILAYIIDELIKIAFFIFILYLFFGVININRFVDDDWSMIALVSIAMLPAMLYSLILETIFEGQTVGKRVMKIKVVKIDGYQASFGDYLTRWSMRIVDIYTNTAIVGGVSIIMSKNAQRIGDIAAGTAVITLKNKFTIQSTILEEIGDAYQPIYPMVVKLSDNDMRIIKDSFDKAFQKKDVETIKKLRVKIEQVTKMKNISGNDIDFIRTVLKDYNYYTQNM